MSVRALPARPVPSARQVEDFVLRGGAPSAPANGAEPKPVLLNIPAALLGRIDEAVKGRPVRTPRHTWILEAILEKLERG